VTEPLKVGIWVLYTDTWPMSFPDLAVAVEERGFESLWVGEHTHIPIDSFPEIIATKLVARLPDPFVLLASAAAVTSRLRLGTAISLAAEYEPIGLAHLLATLDMVSQGRLEYGVGYGSNLAEIRNRGLEVRNRREILRENVLAMKELWANDVASYDGKYVRFSESWSWPKPLQTPHPPILLGANTSKCFPHVIEFCSGWLPNSQAMSTDQLQKLFGELHDAAAASGRDPATFRHTLTVPAQTPSQQVISFAPPSLDEFTESCMTSADLEHYASLGVDRVLVRMDLSAPDVGLATLEHLAEQIL
jgi:probable F420-dependent oxidoreductase